MPESFEEPVVLGEYDPVPGPESATDVRRMREEAEAVMAVSRARRDDSEAEDGFGFYAVTLVLLLAICLAVTAYMFKCLPS